MKDSTGVGLIDVSVPLRADMPIWPGSTGFALTRTLRLEAGDIANVSHLNCDVHVGTHVDAPLHIVAGGRSIDEVPLDVLIGPAAVVDMGDAAEITAEALERRVPPRTTRLLFRTTNSRLWRNPAHTFHRDYVALTLDAARWIVERGVRIVGIDYLSVQRFADDPETHRVLLGAGVIIIEGLCLEAAEAGSYELICLPVLLAGSEAAPARVVLRSLSRGESGL